MINVINRVYMRLDVGVLDFVRLTERNVTAPYDDKLKIKLVKERLAGKSCRLVGSIFKVSEHTVIQAMKLYEAGDLI